MKPIKQNANTIFESIRKTNEHNQEYWSARELSKILDYSEYRHFLPVISKAKEACINSKNEPNDHFEEVLEMIDIGKGGQRQVENVRLSRYACYLIVQNANPSKKIVALGQTYFAIQTRKQELQQEIHYQTLKTEDEKRLFLRNELKTHNKKLAQAAKNAGVETPFDYAIFQDHGYKGLYGGMGAKQIHARKKLKKSQGILDHMGSTELAANLFRATQTEEKIRRENIKGKRNANTAHYKVGKKVRETIQELGGTMPENLPSEDSILKSMPQKKIK